MKTHWKTILLAFAAALLWTAVNAHAQQLAVWNDATKTYVALTAGPGIKIDLAAKTISATAPTVKPRKYNAALVYDSVCACWPLPALAVPASVVVTVSGLRYLPGFDYTIETSASWPGQSVLKANPTLGNMPFDGLVVVDYDPQ
jgi:hypothetical protein